MVQKLVEVNVNKQLVKTDVSKLPIKDELSYSRIDTLSCPYKYKLKYVEKNYTDIKSIALEIGTACHYAMEQKYNNVKFKDSHRDFLNGCEEAKGLNQIIDDYPFEYYDINKKSNMSYEDKVEIFINKLKNEPFENDWICIGTEVPFKIIYKDKSIIKGSIDRVDKNIDSGEIRVIDYKTNNQLFDSKKLTTPLQMYIYSLACKELYGDYPTECIYDMLFLDTKQYGGTKGWMKRGEKKLDKLLDKIIWYKSLGNEHYEPNPTPLCFWCDYCKTNPNSNDKFNSLCDYYSLWTPEENVFKTNMKWIEPCSEDDDWDDDWN